MQSVVVCDGDKAEREQLLECIRRYCRENRQELAAEGCADWPELYEKLGQAEPEVIFVAQDGVEGLNTITNMHLAPGKIIWFSDLDFGVQAYRLCVAYFCKKPVTYGKVERALGRFRKMDESRNI
ncbi:hypothetical protein [Eisenbergiella porci]|uniref:hypothetical protein n=1 Tax=Eisenbergiella porci TaxID=2652274 RepID=UPI002A80DCED|nr:hypothetical protein [Eisenbergiella porci]